jgi:hypothetical protein
MKSAFIVTSAINTKFGVFSSEQRLQQTLDTITSIKKKAADAKIIAVELAGISPTGDQKSVMQTETDLYIDYSQDPNVVGIYNSTDNWDIVKNTTEVMGFRNALEEMLKQGSLDGVDRVFKISGRYTLSDGFNLDEFEKHADRIVVAKRKNSQFPTHVTGGITQQYMSRLWSWPKDLTNRVIDAYDEGFSYIAQTIAAGGYCDIEHMLFKFLPADQLVELERIGVQGNIAPNGHPVID